jgi:hypothetical protein
MNDFFRRSAVTREWVDARPLVYDMISAWFANKAKQARKVAR